MSNENCIFCKIIKGEIPCRKIYETENILAFLDINPVNPGHTLVIPKQHYELIEQVPEDILAELIKAIKKITPAIKKAAGTDSNNLAVNNGKTAGQVVPHVHFHIMPRHENDGLKLWEGKSHPDNFMEKTQKDIVNFIKQ